MAYVIVDGCSKDELCIEACPTDCIHPKSTEPQFQEVDQLFVEPQGCIDCGACVGVCPTGSIMAESDVPPEKQAFIERNAGYFAAGATSERPETWE